MQRRVFGGAQQAQEVPVACLHASYLPDAAAADC